VSAASRLVSTRCRGVADHSNGAVGGPVARALVSAASRLAPTRGSRSGSATTFGRHSATASTCLVCPVAGPASSRVIRSSAAGSANGKSFVAGPTSGLGTATAAGSGLLAGASGAPSASRRGSRAGGIAPPGAGLKASRAAAGAGANIGGVTGRATGASPSVRSARRAKRSAISPPSPGNNSAARCSAPGSPLRSTRRPAPTCALPPAAAWPVRPLPATERSRCRT